MERFDRHGVSFVSVTQQFNTTSSMGRLTLNVLLSFAQFEREIISERTRDKMSAARHPPDPVKPAFNEVNEAQQEREKLINQARSAYNQVIPKARGEAARAIEESRGYALERVNQARGEASKFNSVFREYLRAKDVTRQRIYLETMNKVMQNVGRKLITDEKASGILAVESPESQLFGMCCAMKGPIFRTIQLLDSIFGQCNLDFSLPESIV